MQFEEHLRMEVKLSCKWSRLQHCFIEYRLLICMPLQNLFHTARFVHESKRNIIYMNTQWNIRSTLSSFWPYNAILSPPTATAGLPPLSSASMQPCKLPGEMINFLQCPSQVHYSIYPFTISYLQALPQTDIVPRRLSGKTISVSGGRW